MLMICIPRETSAVALVPSQPGAPCYDFCRDVSMRIRYRFGFFAYGPTEELKSLFDTKTRLNTL